MDREFKHPQIFSDVPGLCQSYYPLHNNLPKPFRFAVGERILAELAECLRLIVLASAVDKKSRAGHIEGGGISAGSGRRWQQWFERKQDAPCRGD